MIFRKIPNINIYIFQFNQNPIKNKRTKLYITKKNKIYKTANKLHAKLMCCTGHVTL